MPFTKPLRRERRRPLALPAWGVLPFRRLMPYRERVIASAEGRNSWREARETLKRTKVTNQGKSNGFFANEQGQVFHAGERGRTVTGEFFGD